MSPVYKLICCVGVFLLFGIHSDLAAPPVTKSKVVQEYWKTLERELGRQWYIAVETNMKQISTADIRVYFHVTADRRLELVRIVPQKSDDVLTKTTLDVLANVKSPPIPQELLSSPDQLYDDVGFHFKVQ